MRISITNLAGSQMTFTEIFSNETNRWRTILRGRIRRYNEHYEAGNYRLALDELAKILLKLNTATAGGNMVKKEVFTDIIKDEINYVRSKM